MNALRRYLVALSLLLALQAAHADIGFRKWEDPDEEKWQEEAVTLPEYPKEENLREFYVSAATANHFFIDAKSLAPGNDGVVRYALVVKTAGGATNVSFEGIRCSEMEVRLYATGRADGQWAKARISEWKRIENKPVNRHHASLSRDYFCPSGIPIRSAEEGLRAISLGKHPDAK